MNPILAQAEKALELNCLRFVANIKPACPTENNQDHALSNRAVGGSSPRRGANSAQVPSADSGRSQIGTKPALTRYS
jgi:hypothetical protein